MRRRTAKVILYILLLLAGFMGVSLWSAWLLTHPETIPSGLTPANFQLPFENVELRAKDGTAISGWFIASSVPERPAVVVLHGYPAEKGDMLFTASSLYPDFNILLIDFRGLGKSGGCCSTLGIQERWDVEAAMDFLQTRGFHKAGVLGFSLGGTAAILAAAEDPRIAAVVSYASYADLTLIGQETYRGLFILRYPLVELMKLWGRALWGIDTDVSPRLAAERLKIPVLIVHTMKDEQIDFKHAEILRKALKNNSSAEFYFPAEGRHGELPADFEDRAKNFFLKHIYH